MLTFIKGDKGMTWRKGGGAGRGIYTNAHVLLALTLPFPHSIALSLSLSFPREDHFNNTPISFHFISFSHCVG